MPKQVQGRVWMAWAFVPLFSGIAFILAGRRAKQRTWEIVGWLLMVLTVVALPMSELEKEGATDAYDVVINAVVIGWMAAIAAVFLIRPRYEKRMAALGQGVQTAGARRAASPVVADAQAPAAAAQPQVAASRSGLPPTSIPSPAPVGRLPHQQASVQSPAPPTPAPVTPRHTEDQLAAAGLGSKPLDLNTATAAELAALPVMDPTLAERVIGYREGLGGFRDFAHFVNAVGLQPHQAEQLRQRVTVAEPPRPPGGKGRVLDL